MHSKIIHGCLVTACAMAIAGCAGNGGVAPPVSPAMAGVSHGVPAQTLEQGRVIFTTRCTACHNAEPVGSRSVAEWSRVVDEMSLRTHLTVTQQQTLMAYLSAARSVR
ncbi:MAG: hypothetical protein JWL90_2092 [Chthoniobacteraceae bacterium]|nr:hypothetical protein [Chthoniobacteraceae bacterium]